MFITAASASTPGSGTLRFLLARYRNFRITDGIVVAAMGNRYSGVERMMLLLERNTTFEISEVILMVPANGSDPRITLMLLARKPGCQITEGIFVAVESGRWGTKGNMQILLARKPYFQITESRLAAAIGSADAARDVQILLDRNEYV